MSLEASPQVLVLARDAARQSELEEWLTPGGYQVLTADGLAAALTVLPQRKVACVVAEADVGEGGPVELVARLLHRDPTLAVILLAGDLDVGVAVASMRSGAMDCLPASLQGAELAAGVAMALERRRLRNQERLVARSLREEVGRLTGELRRERQRGDQVALAALESLVCVVEAKDLWLAGHSVRVAHLAASMAAELSCSDEEVEQVRLAGRLHDIGMVGVGEGILSREGPLTPEEFEQVRAHVTIGSQILAPLPGLGAVVDFVRHHHERCDGQGYPDRLTWDAVPWGARVLGVAEVYDALTTARPYREPMPPELAVNYMKELVGSAIGAVEWRALASVVTRRDALVFLVDDQLQGTVGARASALHL
jgi:putative two-component system response regulator